MRVVVIGAGLGGLSAACHLTGAGHEVTVLEREARPGGRAGLLELGGYRFDTGPTVLTMPSLIDEAFGAVGADTADFVDLRPVDPMYRACYEDGSVLRVRHGREAMGDEMQALCFLAGANSIFYCDKLLTTSNPGIDRDQALFDKLGLRPI